MHIQNCWSTQKRLSASNFSATNQMNWPGIEPEASAARYWLFESFELMPRGNYGVLKRDKCLMPYSEIAVSGSYKLSNTLRGKDSELQCSTTPWFPATMWADLRYDVLFANMDFILFIQYVRRSRTFVTVAWASTSHPPPLPLCDLWRQSVSRDLQWIRPFSTGSWGPEWNVITIHWGIFL